MLQYENKLPKASSCLLTHPKSEFYRFSSINNLGCKRTLLDPFSTKNLKIDVWKQPSDSKSPKVIGLLLGDDVPIDFGATKTLYGMETSIISRTYLGEKGVPFYFYFEGGYKTKGFLPGYPLNSGIFWRFGLSSTF